MAEVLRAGSLSDSRVVGLLNRRFVTHAVDLMEGGALSDAKTVAHLTRLDLVRVNAAGGMDNVDGHEIFVFAPKGRLVRKMSLLTEPDAFVAALRELLAKNRKFAKRSKEEKSLREPVAKARLQIQLLDFKGARKTLGRIRTEEARYLLGHLARRESKWKAMEKYFAGIRDPALLPQVRMERAYRLWKGEKYADLRQHLSDFPKKSDRYTEAKYYEGLALYHTGKPDAARAVWRSIIKGHPQDPWIYRADWADASSSGRTFGAMQTDGGKTALGRVGYMGRSNPDLRRSRK